MLARYLSVCCGCERMFERAMNHRRVCIRDSLHHVAFVSVLGMTYELYFICRRPPDEPQEGGRNKANELSVMIKVSSRVVCGMLHMARMRTSSAHLIIS